MELSCNSNKLKWESYLIPIPKGNSVIRLETFEGNHQAIHFYIKNGWYVTKKEEDNEHGFIRVFFNKKRVLC
ncbi:acyltransferase domain-containing protein [Desulfonema magnum]|uniref:Acyltransferase domain-containing protein n=1 Tax=Desulfonema magnum TaxID=45655 RepID=A0A975BIF6_9BACT|nr:acyltransferase domain-containing protein [Desulfonema magnum]